MSLKKSRHVAFEYSFIWLLERDTPEWRDIAGFTRVCCIAEQQSNRDKSVSLFHWFDLLEIFFVGFKGALFQFVLATACSHILSDVAPYNRGAFVFFLYAGPEIFLLLPVS